MDIETDDYGELIRFWLQVRTGEQGSIAVKLARRLHITATAVGYWVRGERAIPNAHWGRIARHFGFPRPGDVSQTPLDALIADARRLWAAHELRRYYRRASRLIRRASLRPVRASHSGRLARGGDAQPGVAG